MESRTTQAASTKSMVLQEVLTAVKELRAPQETYFKHLHTGGQGLAAVCSGASSRAPPSGWQEQLLLKLLTDSHSSSRHPGIQEDADSRTLAVQPWTQLKGGCGGRLDLEHPWNLSQLGASVCVCMCMGISL